MVITLGANIIIAFKVGAIEYGLALYTFFPQALRNAGTRSALALTNTGWQYFIYPTHDNPLINGPL